MKILLIEDMPHVAERIRNSLKNLGLAESAFADNAKKAREFLQTSAFDMVICEVSLKGISCLEMSHLARSKNKHCCVIIITSLENSDIAEKAVKEGAFDFIIRPAQMDKLDNLIKLYLAVKK
ncbi:MAG: response regulator [Elusimicrobia bacterium]|nr:response regulator [Elusimicrobiota bacterium]